MNWNLVVGISIGVTAVATVVYTIGTFLLWRSTKKALDATKEAFKLNFLMAMHQISTSADVSGTDPSGRFAGMFRQARTLDALKRVFPELYETLFPPKETAPEGGRSSPNGV